MHNLDNTHDLLDIRDIIARVEELESERDDFQDEQNEQHPPQRVEWALADEDAAAELSTLSELLSDLRGEGGDEQWRGDWYPLTLIRDSYFEEYARELVYDCEDIPRDLPSWIEIDWGATASNVRMDYMSTDYDGVTYWYR